MANTQDVSPPIEHDAGLISVSSSSSAITNANDDHSLPDGDWSLTRTKCDFLETLPLEIRICIYEYLLVNPALGSSNSVQHRGVANHCQTGNYGLSHEILRTSRQVYNEAGGVLYGSNTFCMAICGLCWDTEMDRLCSCVCPLFRYVNSNPRGPVQKFSALPPTVAKVRRWKWLIATGEGGLFRSDSATPQLAALCRAISKSPLQSLEILIVQTEHEGSNGGCCENMEKILRPLRLLRNLPVQGLLFRDPEIQEIPDKFRSRHYDTTLVSLLPALDVSKGLADLVQGDTPVEFAFDMFPFLLRYAQAFERYNPFKWDMGWSHGYDMLYAELPPCYSSWLRRGHQNTLDASYQNGGHPVESGLKQARIAARIEDSTQFKSQRLLVLQYLEPQYQRVRTAYNNVLEFIEKEKLIGNLLGANLEMDFWDYQMEEEQGGVSVAEGIVVLEELAQALRRDHPVKIKALIKQHQKWIDRIYYAPEREGALANLNRDFEIQHTQDFKKNFISAFNHMEDQYMDILKARSLLYKTDICGEPGCDIGLEDIVLGEKVKFHVGEPVFNAFLNLLWYLDR
ncbi:hypothetical protein V8E51_014028 [Hyaloscypha variabilis]